MAATSAGSAKGKAKCLCCDRAPKHPVTIESVDSNFEREPLIRPFGFKGAYMSEIWQTVAMLQMASGVQGIGLGTQSVLWSDARIFAFTGGGGGCLCAASKAE